MKSRFIAAALAAATLAACGAKGDPLPPFRPAPARAEGLSALRVEGRPIVLRFVVPAANDDGTVPVDITAIRVFALTRPQGDPAPSLPELINISNLVATVPVQAAPAQGLTTTATPAVPEPGAQPGATLTWEDTAENPPAATPMSRYYAVAGISRRNRIGVGSDMVTVPLDVIPGAPSNLTVSFTDKVIKLDWLGASAETRYRVYEVEGGRPADLPINAAPLSATSFEDPRVTFGTERCYVVRAVRVAASASSESAPAGPICITPRDVFPPPAPAGLTAVANQGAVSLIWDPVETPDLAGYLVLRAEAPGDKLLPLFDTPITETTYKDATTVAGTRYVYAVVAVDKATPANRSAASNRVEETGRN
ncbi:MAG: hypothetical protein M3R55_10280 [Acidobacteriota bacterium]|nr:hypothetical protein [Acidobacteriota bacterium]